MLGFVVGERDVLQGGVQQGGVATRVAHGSPGRYGVRVPHCSAIRSMRLVRLPPVVDACTPAT
ncbi:MAG: hypothetical protein ACR2JO_12240, partial [Mycobacteriales bacterium]